MSNKLCQCGSGYSSDPSQNVGNQLVYKAYNDCNPPSIINGTLKMNNCNQSGGKKVSKRKSSKRKSSKRKVSKRKSSKRKSSKRKVSKRKVSKRKSSKQCGGMPSKFPFPAKQKSNFSGDPKTHTYDAKQSHWLPNAY